MYENSAVSLAGTLAMILFQPRLCKTNLGSCNQLSGRSFYSYYRHDVALCRAALGDDGFLMPVTPITARMLAV